MTTFLRFWHESDWLAHLTCRVRGHKWEAMYDYVNEFTVYEGDMCMRCWKWERR